MTEVSRHELSKLRPHLKYSLAWRLVSELMRRHHASRKLRVLQFFPGLSPWGTLRVTEGKPYVHGHNGARVDFVVGGGGVGSTTSGELTLTRYTALLDGIEGVDTERLVDEIEDALGWPRGTKHPTTPPVLVARLIARFLERYALSPNPFRLSPGGLDNAASYAGGEPVSWLLGLPEGKKIDSLDENAACDYATRFWLLHVDRTGGPHGSWDVEKDGPAVVLDLGTAECVPLHAAKRVNLMQRYLAHDRKLLPLLHELETLLHAP